MVSELPADFRSLECLVTVGELQTIYFTLLILQAFDGYTTLVKVVKKHGMPCDACAFVFFKWGIANLLYLLLGLFSRRIGLCFLVLSFSLYFLCHGQAFRATYFLRYSCCSVAYKSGIIDLSVKADTIGNDMKVPVIGVLVRYCHLLVVVKSHLFGKQMGYPHKFRYGQFFLVLRCDAYFNTEELIPATAVIVADHFHFLVDSLWLPAAKVVEGKPTT